MYYSQSQSTNFESTELSIGRREILESIYMNETLKKKKKKNFIGNKLRNYLIGIVDEVGFKQRKENRVFEGVGSNGHETLSEETKINAPRRCINPLIWTNYFMNLSYHSTVVSTNKIKKVNIFLIETRIQSLFMIFSYFIGRIIGGMAGRDL